MESPLKKRKVASQESLVPNASSTPRRDTGDTPFAESPFISDISHGSISSGHARRALQFFGNKENAPKAMSLLDMLDKSTDLSDGTEEEVSEDELNYDEFFTKCKRIVLKGPAWNLYKPIDGNEGSLYYQIVTDPRGSSELAEWFAQYCSDKPIQMGTYILYKFYFDCSGYQKFDFKGYYTFPPKFEDMLRIFNSTELIEKIFKTKKFLFADNARLPKILKYGIYNFLQKFIVEAHKQNILYGALFSSLLKLLLSFCKNATYRPLVYTAYIFVIKILTSICTIKEKIADSAQHKKENALLDNYINVLYMCFTKVWYIADKECSTLRIACINELKIWMHYSAKIFVDYYNCVDVLKHFIMDKFTSVRLAALELCSKMIQNEEIVSYLKAGPIETLVDAVWGRVGDIYMPVALRAIEVFSTMVTHCLPVIQRKGIFEKLIEIVYHKDYRMGSAAGKCVVDIITREKADEVSLLLYICKMAQRFPPNLKPLVVESCIEHTNILQNWPLIIQLFFHSDDKVTPIELKETLSELFLESVHVTLTGHFSKVRAFSKLERTVHYANNGIIANEVYPNLKRIIGLFSKDEIIIQNFFKILVKISAEYLTKEHCQVADQLIQLFMKLFALWNSKGTLIALLDYLLYVNEHMPSVKSTSMNAIDDLKKYVSEELYKSFKSKDNHTLIMARKASLVFSKIDLSNNIEWSKLLLTWTLIDSNAEFIEDMLTCCQWCLMWKIKLLSTSQLPSRYDKPELAKEISLISNMFTQFFSCCNEVLMYEDKSIKLKTFERICETSISVYFGLDNICKQVRALQVLKLNLKEDVQKINLIEVFELSAAPSDPSDAIRFRKYILYIYQMSCLTILPTDSISIILKYFHKYYDHYGKLIEAILLAIREKNENWISLLLINTISILYEELKEKHGVVDMKTHKAKAILNLSKRFHEFKKIMSPKIAAKLLIFAVNYASVRKLYDFLILVKVFTEDVQHFPVDCQEIIRTIKDRVPRSDIKNDSLLHFVQLLREPAAAAETMKSRKMVKKAPPKKVKASKLKAQRKNLFKTSSQTTTDSGASDHMSIHDTSSDDLDLENLNIDD